MSGTNGTDRWVKPLKGQLEPLKGPLGGFKEFLMRGNVVELAVAVVIGAAFTKIVDAVVKGVINPVVGALGSKELEGYRSCFSGPCHVNAKGEVDEGIYILWGQVASATLTFVLTAGVVYFLMILPMNHLNELRRRRLSLAAQAEATPAQVTELELLTEIRDLLARERGGEQASGPSDADPREGERPAGPASGGPQ